MGSIGHTPLLLAGGAALAVWLMLFGLLTGRLDERRRREQRIAMVRGTATADTSREVRRHRSPRLALRRPRGGLLATLSRQLKHRGIEMQAANVLTAVIAGALIGGVGGNALVGSWGLLAGATVGSLGPLAWIRRRASARHRKINAQLEELLQVVAGNLTAGQSFLQAFSAGAEKVGEPLGVELRVMLNEVELGSTLEDALGRLRERARDEDLDLVIDAVLIQRRVGGNLAEVLTNIAVTIRDRIRMRGEVKALTGQARMSGWMLGLLPFGIAGVLFVLSPEYMQVLFQTPIGRLLIGIGMTAELIGFFLMRKIADIRV